jgi:hypothetical protein
MDYREIQAQVAKELTLEFAKNLKLTNTSNFEAMNENLAKIVTEFYEKAFDSVRKKMEEE